MSETILEIKELKNPSETIPILLGLSLQINKGEVVVILGPSGCGKSTLLRCLNGLESIQGGDILLDGQSIVENKKDFHLVRQKIGMVFQSYELFPHLDVLQTSSRSYQSSGKGQEGSNGRSFATNWSVVLFTRQTT